MPSLQICSSISFSQIPYICVRGKGIVVTANYKTWHVYAVSCVWNWRLREFSHRSQVCISSASLWLPFFSITSLALLCNFSIQEKWKNNDWYLLRSDEVLGSMLDVAYILFIIIFHEGYFYSHFTDGATETQLPNHGICIPVYPEAYHALSKQWNRFVGFFSCRQICPGS